MYYIKTLNKISEEGLRLFTDEYQLVDETEKASGILVRSQDMTNMDFSKDLLAIARAGAGTNNIPLDRCSEKGIVVFNTPGANANAVKELVLAGLFLSSRDILEGCQWTKSLTENVQNQVEKGKSPFAGQEVKGKTLGVLGLGAIGVKVANAASDLGMKVVAFDPFLSIKAALDLSRKISVCEKVEDLIPQCDYISIHVPTMESTKGMLNKNLFSLMKENTRLLNFSRDSIVVDKDLSDAIDSGKIARYVTDFPNEALLGMNNVIAIPHLGASTAESEENCAAMAVEQIRDYLENGNISNSVNFPSCSLGPSKRINRIAIQNKNIPAILGRITGILADMNINISDLINRSKGDVAYTLVDVDSHIEEEDLRRALGVEGILHIRII